MRRMFALSVLLVLCGCTTTKKVDDPPPREEMRDTLQLRIADAEVALTHFHMAEALKLLDDVDKATEEWKDLTPAENVALGWQAERAAEIRFIATIFGEADDAEKLKGLYAADPDRMFDRFAGDGTTLDSPGCYRLFVISGEDDIAERGFQRMLRLVEDAPVKRFRLLVLKASALIGMGDLAGRIAYQEAETVLQSLPLAKVEDLSEYGSYCMLPALLLSRGGDHQAALANLQAQLAANPDHPVKARLERYAETFKTLNETWPAEKALYDGEENLPRVEMVTSEGRMVITLFEDDAPNTVASFIELVEKGFYNGLVFHRVVPHFVVQGGDPDGTGEGGPGYSIKREATRKHFRGALGMARSADPDSAGSQFYFCLASATTHHLDEGYAVFGRVSEGLDVMDKLRLGSRIISAKVLAKRPHEYKVEKLPEKE